MTLELVGISVLWLFLFGYVIIGSIDFGAGFFSTYSDWSGKKHIIHKVIQRYLSPVWEVTNVFLVFFFVGIVGFFPKTAYYYGTALLVPASISIMLLAIRGSYYAFGTYGAKDNKLYTFLYGVTGILIPASFTTVLTISEGGFIEVTDQSVRLLYSKLFASPYSWSVVLLAIVSVLFISASFLTYYAHAAGDEKATALLRIYTLLWSLPSILAAFVVLFTLKQHNSMHFARMLDIAWVFVLSVLCFAAAVYLFYKKKRYGTAFGLVTLQYGFAFFGYGFSHYPYLLYPYLTIYDGFTNQTMAIALIVAFIAGLCLLLPSLYLLLRLFLFDKKYVQGQR
ncbi:MULTISPECIES: cytochrome d ubiquinol oxidase subunit II [Aneurinibacillus]|uniref:Cytochrome bd-I ubiquinol oxidase subunit 2 apoprotein n=1 Tax=Aneurinibacillus thermoaerophilus TaxID=143495 RepID=A0A1G7Y1V2_ANETH|nr:MULTISPECIES: cytochrome d ubiquinol oxidase subunit II [Aneurinibacillus]AMA72962.1 cytochrome D ubiquinol oxidase subunit II [Aneurinibacillus sp. XH2]MED0675903.1 cytochrome d ubiquinol oxidase subunit II [Aneurinibacillus thermoaerophilus]MED0677822.1 cytochrome d ubiquinol oxidase subunit II [Aneurinibacillus thermoaerophilus]MED0737571.1 cytochrome d ubiquinol oxidase subunit II [Aneurinibacillus thermoaerophilus]MED0758142.1 cytochrome d ubiquinol oxidase subunit II [Aneurinibacillus